MAQSGTEWYPRPQQAKVLEAACTSGLKRNVLRICKEAGVPVRTFYNWMRRDAGFRAAWADLWREMVTRHLPGVMAAAITKAQGGDVPAQRLLSEIAGIVKNQVEQSGELRIVYVNDWRGDRVDPIGDGPASDAPSGAAGDQATGAPVQPVESRPAMAENDDGDVDSS